MKFLARRTLNAAALLAVDGAVLALSLLMGDLVMLAVVGAPVSLRYSLLIIPVWWIGALWFDLAPGWGIDPVTEIRRVEQLLAGIFAAAAVAVFTSNISSAASRGSYAAAFAVAAVGLPAGRWSAREALSRCRWWGAPAVIYGGGPVAAALVESLLANPSLGYRPVGVFGDAPIGNLPRLGAIDEASPRVDVAFLADDGMPPDRWVRLLDGPLSRYRHVMLLPGLLETPSIWVQPWDCDGLLALRIANNLLDSQSRWLKRAAETSVVVLALPLWLPVCLLVAAVVAAVDRHSPFFRQQRIGRGGQPFFIWKFRTMVADAESRLEERLASDPELRRQWDGQFKLEADWRVTRLGRWLRRWSLDELPQLWNVLRGDMALVGPRPLPAYHHAALPAPARVLRERVQPGITGLWQVRGRGEPDAAVIAKMDAYYVRNWSIWMDLVILVRTVWSVIRGRGAV